MAMPDFGRWGANGGDPSLNDIHRTDQFLDALAGQQPVYATDREEAELANLLAGWRDDVRETPAGTLLSVDDAVAALERSAAPSRRRRLSLAVVGSAAAAVLCLGGFGAVVAGSGPGDALYGLRTMMFGDQTPVRDDAVILAAQTEMQQVQQLIEQGDWDGAKAKLEAVTTTVATVGDVERRENLVSQWQELTVKVEAQDPAATVAPGAPLPTFPELPAVVLDPNSLSITPPSDTTGPSETTGTSEPTDTTSPTSGTTETSAPSATTETSAPTETASPTSSVAPSPTSTSAAAPTSAPAPSSSVVPAPTSTLLEQSSSARPTPTSAPTSTAPAPTTSTAPAPTPTQKSTTAPAPAPVSTTTVIPTAAAEEAEEPAPSPTAQVTPTTTTTVPVAPAGDEG
ncbi:anti-sigma-D factor RsdA [Mycolicibacterium vaccae]|uniref:anti-sigma-D factor RsdA n=1 Tax=Mycolicibacterium vaccae TaxID=1810 RepID=UPI003D06C9DD